LRLQGGQQAGEAVRVAALRQVERNLCCPRGALCAVQRARRLARQHVDLRQILIETKLWEVSDIVALVESAEASVGPRKRGPYKKRVKEISN
jgi:hypothetical protein